MSEVAENYTFRKLITNAFPGTGKKTRSRNTSDDGVYGVYIHRRCEKRKTAEELLFDLARGGGSPRQAEAALKYTLFESGMAEHLVKESEQ